jgi:hypothetical protein
VIASVRDVANDQGGRVSVRWTASDLDAVPNGPIVEYDVWREVPAAYALVALRNGARMGRPAEPDRRGGAIRTTASGLATYYWEYVGSQPAHGHPAYSYSAPTLSDSLAGSNPKTLFMVEAYDEIAGYYYGSAPDSGYSVDNLAPAPPGSFAGEYAAGVTRLHWNPSPEGDLSVYRLHRGTSADFAPGPANLVAEQPDTGYVDVAGQPYYYKLAAVDVHGNSSAYVSLLPQGVLVVFEGPSPRRAWLGRPTPNPAPDAITVRFGLPRAGPASLVVFDLTGRRVWQSGTRAWAAGEHQIRWDGIDARGHRAAPGVYQLMLMTGDGTPVQRAVVAR